MSDVKPTLKVAMIGYRFMGRAHSHGWRTAPRFFDLPADVELALIVGRGSDAEDAARSLGWAGCASDWQVAIERADIDVIDICSPSDTHAEIAIAALAAGKHVLCEKPLANTVEQAEAMTASAGAARARGVQSMLGFTYRRVPAIRLARDLVLEGRLGVIRQVRASYLQDWLFDETVPMSWRLDRSVAGSGALGDLASHAVDAVQFITGLQVINVVGLSRTFVSERPWPQHHEFEGTGKVTVDDAVAFMAELTGGALATFEATRMATGRKNSLRIEVNGSLGSIAFDLEEMNVLEYFDASDQRTAGFRRILVTEPSHPYIANWWPAGHSLGYDHGFTNQAADFITAVYSGEEPRPSFADGLLVQRVLDAVDRSIGSNGWQAIPA